MRTIYSCYSGVRSPGLSFTSVASVSVVELLTSFWHSSYGILRVEDGIETTTYSYSSWIVWSWCSISGVGAFEGEEESDGSGGLSHEEGR